jgi:uncharacterized membrane-anchored protein
MRVPSIRFAHVRRGKAAEPPGIVGVARIDPRTKVLVRRLEPGDIAIIDHPDLDRVSADELIACRVAAVVNASRSVTGRYPNLGPELLFEAGIPLVDDVGKDLLSRVTEGAAVRLDKDILYNDADQVIAKGVLLTEASLATAMEDANAGTATQIDAFAANTLEFLRRERDLLNNGVELPELATSMRDKHVLVVVRGYRYREDLRALRPYIREYRPVLMAVDGGADALLEVGYRPHVIIGDMDSVSDEALAAGAELVVHAYPDGRAPGMERLAGLGLDALLLPAPDRSLNFGCRAIVPVTVALASVAACLTPLMTDDAAPGSVTRTIRSPARVSASSFGSAVCRNASLAPASDA